MFVGVFSVMWPCVAHRQQKVALDQKEKISWDFLSFALPVISASEDELSWFGGFPPPLKSIFDLWSLSFLHSNRSLIFDLWVSSSTQINIFDLTSPQPAASHLAYWQVPLLVVIVEEGKIRRTQFSLLFCWIISTKCCFQSRFGPRRTILCAALPGILAWLAVALAPG